MQRINEQEMLMSHTHEKKCVETSLKNVGSLTSSRFKKNVSFLGGGWVEEDDECVGMVIYI